MQEIISFIAKARERGIISAEQDRQMLALLKGGSQAAGSEGFSLEQDKDIEDSKSGGVSESPRLVRGFHDVLITIGILTALGGLWVLGSAFAVVPAVIVLAEIFVRKQALALPAFVLTIVLAMSVQVSLLAFVGPGAKPPEYSMVLTGLALAFGAFYWRYRIPVALASLIAAGFGLVFFLAVSGYDVLNGAETTLESGARVIGIIGFVLAAGLFLIALRFDIKDPLRMTRGSDVAFWLHLTTAPMLLYSLFVLIFGDSGFWWSKEPSVTDAVIAILVITAMIVVGIIIDRRAFVTSGLISLGVALYIITESAGITLTNIGAFSFLAVGVIVLLLGTGWKSLRRIVVSSLPGEWQKKLPPVGA